jgi:hypothetical protein
MQMNIPKMIKTKQDFNREKLLNIEQAVLDEIINRPNIEVVGEFVDMLDDKNNLII